MPRLQTAEDSPTATENQARNAFLNSVAGKLGVDWADRFREQLHRDGRLAAGGWPGTIAEARARVERLLLPTLAQRRMPKATSAERADLARALYAAARQRWLERREIEDEELDSVRSETRRRAP